jgi:hypothetical protein
VVRLFGESRSVESNWAPVFGCALMIGQLKWIHGLDNRGGFFNFQFACLSVRWGAIVLIGFFLAEFIPNRVYGTVLIVLYAAATVALELAPTRVLALVGHFIGRPDLAGMAVSETNVTASPATSSQSGKRLTDGIAPGSDRAVSPRFRHRTDGDQ